MRKVLWVLPLLSMMGAQCGSPGNCTVTKNEATGVATISCPDGTSVDVAPGDAGVAGPPGDAGVGVVVTEVPLQGEGGHCLCTGGVKVQAGDNAPAYVCNGENGLHNGGDGACVAAGTCSAGHHDGGGGACVPTGACSSGYFLTGAGCTAMVSLAGGSPSGADWPSGAGGSVTIPGFKLDGVPVTVAAYAACVAAAGCTAPTTPAPPNGSACNWNEPGREAHPINCVGWSQATAYCAWAGKRLPTVEEWQWAASNGGTTTFPWGNASPDNTLAHWSGSGVVQTHTAAVGTHPAGATSTGLQDMAGNVWEWTSSDYGVGIYKRSMGGAWEETAEFRLKASYRDYLNPPETGTASLGFRCAQ